MRRHIGLIVLGVLVVALLLTGTVAFTAGTEEKVLVQTFGRTTRVYDGRTDAGLKLKWPWPVERTVRYDARTFVFEDTYHQMNTKDVQNVLVTMFCAWRIRDPLAFQKSVETVEAGQEQIRQYLRDAKQNVISKYRMDQLVNTDPKEMKLEDIEREIRDAVVAQASERNGVDIVMVGIKSFGLPENVTQKVIDAMKAERKREVEKLEKEGEATAQTIRVLAELARKQIMAFAERRALQIKSEGDRARAKYFRDFSQNPALAVFLRQLETLRATLKKGTVMVLDGSRLYQIGWFRKGPGEEAIRQSSASAAPAPAPTPQP